MGDGITGVTMLADLTFHEWRLEDLGVLNGAVAEVAVFAEEFAMIGGDGDVRVRRNRVEEFLHGAIEKPHGLDLTVAQLGELARVHQSAPRFSGGGVRVEMLEDAVDAA